MEGNNDISLAGGNALVYTKNILGLQTDFSTPSLLLNTIAHIYLTI